MDQHRRSERLAEIPERVEAMIVPVEALQDGHPFRARQPQLLDGPFQFLQRKLAFPGIDHGPTGQKHVRKARAETGDVIVADGTFACLGLRIHADNHGEHIVAAKIPGHFLVRFGVHLAPEHGFQRRHVFADADGVFPGGGMAMDVDGTHRDSPFAPLVGRPRSCRPATAPSRAPRGATEPAGRTLSQKRSSSTALRGWPDFS
jgi:hypothetical protein